MKVNLLIKKCFLLILTFVSFITEVHAYQRPPDVWQVLRNQFSLNHETNQPEVQKQIRWIVSHPQYLQELTKNSEPYIYHIMQEIKKRKLPGEIAILPMIESAYNPFAYSGAGAAGLWQLMPGTGSGLGLKQDWWYDGRRSVVQSTNAALNYLQYLNKHFKGRWILAFAAYDSGEGTIAKSLRAMGRTPYNAWFWSLKLPRETKAYIPRLLAIAEIIKYPYKYKIQIPQIPYQPYFTSIDVGSQIDLNHAAKLANMSYKDLIKLNPGHNRWATAPYEPYRLIIPVEKAEMFSKNLDKLPEDKRVSWQRHKVQGGDTLEKIARHYHTSVSLIKQINAIKNNIVKPNQYLLIPKNNSSETILKDHPPKIDEIDNSTNSKFHRVVHIVQPDDSYDSIAALYRVNPSEIRYWNSLPSARTIKSGTQLVIWKRIGLPSGKYIIKSGDTLSVIAKRYQTSVKSLLFLNPQLKPKALKPGKQIIVA